MVCRCVLFIHVDIFLAKLNTYPDSPYSLPSISSNAIEEARDGYQTRARDATSPACKMEEVLGVEHSQSFGIYLPIYSQNSWKKRVNVEVLIHGEDVDLDESSEIDVE